MAGQGLARQGKATHTAHSTECAAAWSGEARRGAARPGGAGPGAAGQGYTHGAFHGVRRSVVWSKSVSPGTHQTRDFVAWRGSARLHTLPIGNGGQQWGWAWLGEARLGSARQGKARLHTLPIRESGQKLGLARRGTAWRGLAGLGEAPHTAHRQRWAAVGHGTARHGSARPGLAGRGGAGRGWAWRGYTHGAFHGVRRSVVWRGAAGRGRAWQGAARQGKARQGSARPGRARLTHRGEWLPRQLSVDGQQTTKGTR